MNIVRSEKQITITYIDVSGKVFYSRITQDDYFVKNYCGNNLQKIEKALINPKILEMNDHYIVKYSDLINLSFELKEEDISDKLEKRIEEKEKEYEKKRKQLDYGILLDNYMCGYIPINVKELYFDNRCMFIGGGVVHTCGFKRIKPLKFLYNLEKVKFIDIRNQIDYSELVNCKRLRSCKFVNCNIENIDFLEHMKLDKLSISGISKVNLHKMPISLKKLSLKSQTLENDFSCLTNLEELSLSDMKLTNIDFVKELKNLKKLRVVNERNLSNWNSMEELKNLEILFAECFAIDFTNIKKCIHLKEITVKSREIKGLQILKNLPNLLKVKLNNEKIIVEKIPDDDLYDLSDEKIFECIESVGNMFYPEDICKIVCYRNLKEIICYYKNNFPELENLHTLFLTSCYVKDCKFVENLPNLENLFLVGQSNVENIEDLQKCNLKTISLLHCTNIQNYEPLGKITTLQELTISYSNCSRIDYLMELPDLKVLSLFHCLDLEKLDILTQVKTLSITYDYIENHSCVGKVKGNDWNFMDYDKIGGYLNLEELILGKGLLDNILFVPKLRNLRKIHFLECNYLRNVNSLVECDNLEEVKYINCENLIYTPLLNDKVKVIWQ